MWLACRQWLAVSTEWRAELKEKASMSVTVRKNYERALLAFEERLSTGAPERIIPNTWGAKSAGKRGAKAQREVRISLFFSLQMHLHAPGTLICTQLAITIARSI